MKFTRDEILFVVLVAISITILLVGHMHQNNIEITWENIKDVFTVGFLNSLALIYKLYDNLKKTTKELEDERLITDARELIDKIEESLHDLDDTLFRVTNEQKERLKEAAKNKDTSELKIAIEETKLPIKHSCCIDKQDK